MKFVIQIVAIILLAYVLSWFMPWWSIAIAAFAGGAVLSTRFNFLAGFLAIGLLWAITAMLIDATAAAPLSERVAKIMTVSKPVLFIVTAVLGGLVGGFAAMTGGALRKDKRKYNY
jgi:hypothetical protein